MAQRRAVILSLVLVAGTATVLGTPNDGRLLASGAFLFLFAYIYAQLTRPKDRL